MPVKVSKTLLSQFSIAIASTMLKKVSQPKCLASFTNLESFIAGYANAKTIGAIGGMGNWPCPPEFGLELVTEPDNTNKW